MSDFREDGALALEWVASYLERAGELPVLSQVEPGAIRSALPGSAPEDPEPFSAVVDDLDSILMPGITHWQSPRFFAYFANSAAAWCGVKDSCAARSSDSRPPRRNRGSDSGGSNRLASTSRTVAGMTRIKV